VWLRLFQAAWFIGFLGSAIVYFLVSTISPPPGRPYVSELFGNEHGGIIDGETPSDVYTPAGSEKANVSPSLKALDV
jgi:hypothetical protein